MIEDKDPPKKRTRSIILWTAVVLAAVSIVGIGSNVYRGQDTHTESGASVSAQASPSPQALAAASASPTSSPAKSPASTSTATLPVFQSLSRGSSGTAVKTLQQWLIQLGYLHDTADGVFGNKTCDAVSAYQSQNSLIATGVADSVTLSSLYSSGAKMAAATPVVTPKATAYPDTQKYADTLTTGQSNALRSAKAYLSFQAFSYDGLIEQLEYEKYSHADAVYAVQHCGADWNEQALQSALSYLNYTAFSYQGLIGQLEYEKFTSKQAAYGADHCGADWSEQAALSAKSYLNYSSFSRDGLIDQLEYEGFTHKQAVYGASANGY